MLEAAFWGAVASRVRVVVGQRIWGFGSRNCGGLVLTLGVMILQVDAWGFPTAPTAQSVTSAAPLSTPASRTVRLQGAIRVHDDSGGDVAAYMYEVHTIRARSQSVQIVGHCRSACTLYLGAGSVCITRSAQLSFHGPSNRGKPLPRKAFETWSRLMADHYPEPIRGWFLRDARHSITDMQTLSGSELIRMGVREC